MDLVRVLQVVLLALEEIVLDGLDDSGEVAGGLLLVSSAKLDVPLDLRLGTGGPDSAGASVIEVERDHLATLLWKNCLVVRSGGVIAKCHVPDPRDLELADVVDVLALWAASPHPLEDGLDDVRVVAHEVAVVEEEVSVLLVDLVELVEQVLLLNPVEVVGHFGNDGGRGDGVLVRNGSRKESESDGLFEGEESFAAFRLPLEGSVSEPLEASEGLLPGESLLLGHHTLELGGHG